MNAAEACADPEENNQRKISHRTIQSLAGSVGGIAQLKEESREYALPESEGAVNTVVDAAGDRQHTTCSGAAPEYGKDTFLGRYGQELKRLKARYPGAEYVGIADGSQTNRTFLSQRTSHQIPDFCPATEYLSKAAHAAYPQKKGRPEREQWLAERCHQLRHEAGAARAIPDECCQFRKRRGLSRTVKDGPESTIPCFENQKEKIQKFGVPCLV